MIYLSLKIHYSPSLPLINVNQTPSNAFPINIKVPHLMPYINNKLISTIVLERKPHPQMLTMILYHSPVVTNIIFWLNLMKIMPYPLLKILSRRNHPFARNYKIYISLQMNRWNILTLTKKMIEMTQIFKSLRSAPIEFKA